jgi:hypothetical protein
MSSIKTCRNDETVRMSSKGGAQLNFGNVENVAEYGRPML